MPPLASLIVSALGTLLYLALYVRYARSKDGNLRLTMLVIAASLALFWLFRGAGYVCLLRGDGVSVVNTILRWSGYLALIPGFVMAARSWRA